jgi:outer membrane protein TolC
MKQLLILLIISTSLVVAQVDSLILPEPTAISLDFLIAEAIENNPQVKSFEHQAEAMEAKVSQAGTLDYPQFTYMREEMPGFRVNEAAVSKFELMQMLRFPSKLSVEKSLAEVRAEHAHHEYYEDVNDIILKLSLAYFELWFVQQNLVLEQENARLMTQFLQSTGTRYSTGRAPQHDVLKAQTELAMIHNSLLTLRQQELATKRMLMTILNRNPEDTLGYAFVTENIPNPLPLDSLIQLAVSQRPMLLHDSLSINESRSMLSLANQELIPDFNIGVEYMTSHIDDFNGWSFRVGVTLPFAPWTLGKVHSMAEEAEAMFYRARAAYTSTKNMVLSDIRTKYDEAQLKKRHLESFQTIMIPQAQQTLEAGLISYQNGKTDFLMLLDSYRTVTSLTKEYFMTRMELEQILSQLKQVVGTDSVIEITE